MVPATGNTGGTARARGMQPGGAGVGGNGGGGKGSFAFRAELDLAELDGRGRPGQAWTGRGVELSRSTLVFRSRRLCYEGRQVVVGVHLVDDKPVPLFGFVAKSDYEGEGLYRTVLSLNAIPEDESIKAWVSQIQPRVV